MTPNQFIHQWSWADLPAAVQNQARRCLLDTLGTAIAARQTDLSRIVHDFAAQTYGGRETQLWQDGRFVSPPGAALANGMTIDALDIHDGYTLTKGHAGAAIVPATLATIRLNPKAQSPISHRQSLPITGQELLTTLVIGYEIAQRAGRALHATACDFHTSGAWNALGCAAVTARRLQLNETQTRHALGIAEYHGPRSQMMRCIDHPTMVKDGSGWGAMAGVSAALLAAQGFTGAPAITVEAAEVAEFWDDIGQNWLILDQYFKPHAVCRWAQPAITGILAVRRQQQLAVEDIARIRVYTFHEAVRLNHPRPQNTEAAQYSLPFPVAAALVHGRLGAAALSGDGLTDPQVLALADRVELAEDDEFNGRFPARRFARVQIETKSGQKYSSGDVEAQWEASDPPTDEELRQKFRWLAQSSLSEATTARLESLIWTCADLPDVTPLFTQLALDPTPENR